MPPREGSKTAPRRAPGTEPREGRSLPSGGSAQLARALTAALATAFLVLAVELVVLGRVGDRATQPRALSVIARTWMTQAALGGACGAVLFVLAWGRRPGGRRFLFGGLALALAFTFGVHAVAIWGGPRGLKSPLGLGITAGAGLLGLALAALACRRDGASGGRRALVGVVGLAAIALLAVGFTSRAEKSGTVGPNVVLVVLDTTRFDRLSAFGYERETTPALERLAAEGTRFERCYSAAPWTVPSHAAMFTGEHTSTHGATRQHPILDSRLRTLAERMTTRGYHTVSFTKKSWLSAETGLLRGFREVHDLYNPPLEPAVARLAGFLRPRARAEDKGGKELTRVAADWLAEHAADGPFFAFFNFNEAHSDLRPPQEYRRRYLEGERYRSPWGHTEFPDNHAFSTGALEYSAEELGVFSDLYDAEIAYQDALLGRLRGAFEAAGVLDDTLLLVTADHGENLGEHGLLGHEMSLHDTLLHVPLVVRWPGRVPAGARVDEPVENRLVGRLIESLLDGGAPVDGAALALALRDKDFDGVVSEEYPPSFQTDKWDFQVDPRFNVIRKSLIDGSRKLMWRSDQSDPALYDLLEDPGETVDLATLEVADKDELLQRLLARKDLWRQLDASDVEFSGAMQSELKKMGYL